MEAFRTGFLRRHVIRGGSAALIFPASAARAQPKSGVALVVGNSKYSWEAPLPNVSRDVRDVANRFRALGLETNLIENVGLDAFNRALDKFFKSSGGAKLAAFYFAGHGVTWNRATFLVPVDVDVSTAGAVGSLVKTGDVYDGMSPANDRLLIFDNCRNSPADGWREHDLVDLAGGYGPFSSIGPTVSRALNLYSTAPGHVALDGPPGGNSPFASNLLELLETPSIDLQTLPAKLRRNLLIATRGRQFLFERNGYAKPVFLTSSGNSQASPATPNRRDSSNVVELTNAYSIAQQNKMPIPLGVVGYRSNAGPGEASKAGAYQFTGVRKSLSLLVVLSAQESGADVILVTPVYEMGNSNKYVWRYLRAVKSAGRFELPGVNGKPFCSFDWDDANSGSLTMLKDFRGTSGSPSYETKFSRLDG